MKQNIQYIHYYESPIGRLTISSDGDRLRGLWIEGQKYSPNISKTDIEDRSLPIFKLTDKWLDIYFGGKEPDFLPPVSLKGSEFRRTVWDILITIPYGKTMTYGEIANKIALERGLVKMSARAVGGAVGHNPISIIIPCHRVVGTKGNLTGYAGGIDRKVKLLTLEGVEITGNSLSQGI